MRLAAALVIAAALPASAAHANGAFPDSMAIFLPPDRPNEIVLATNFGVVISRDGGASFQWTCEGAISPFPYMYAMSAAPENRIFAADAEGLFSSNDACTWARASGPPSMPEINDVFADPSDPARVLVLGRGTLSATTSWGLFESRDGGRTFGEPIYLTPPNFTLESVEVSASDPRVMYMTMAGARTPQRFLLRSGDGGASFETYEITEQVRTRLARIAAVDRTDPDTLYLRLVRTTQADPEAFAISRDGGRTIELKATFTARMTSFLERADGTLLIGTFGAGYISTDRGATVVEWPGAPHIRALGERAGALFAAADDALDGYAIGVTRDGSHWIPMLQLARITGPLACPEVQAACTAAFPDLLARIGPLPDGGVVTDAVSEDTPARDAGAIGAEPASSPEEGCSCAAAPPSSLPSPPWSWLLLLLLSRCPARRAHRRREVCRASAARGDPRRHGGC